MNGRMLAEHPLYVGIDLGTSGCRAIAIDAQGEVRAQASRPLPEPHRAGNQVEQAPLLWWEAMVATLTTLLQHIDGTQIQRLAVDGTSSTVLLCDELGEPCSTALMYNDARALAEAQRIRHLAPANCAAHGPSSGLAKLLWLQSHRPPDQVRHVVHQADWLMGKLCGQFGLSDTNNCLKMGYDPVAGGWPDWLVDLGVRRDWLPRVLTPGTVVGRVDAALAARIGLNSQAEIVAGTTDSTAAFIATGASAAGEAVTSLGSTLVVKVIAEQPIFAPEYGVYSQPLGNLWLVGGGSNAGGTVLRKYFTPRQIEQLSARLDPEHPSGLDYYPLPEPGERFPVCDPQLSPRLTPRPEDDARFFQGILEGIAQIERQGYRLLAQLGAPYPQTIRTVGGGAGNSAWTQIRQRLLQVPMIPARQVEAAYGAALLAQRNPSRIAMKPPHSRQFQIFGTR